MATCAARSKRPRELLDGIPAVLKEAVKSMVDVGAASSAMERTATLRKWMLRAKHFRDSQVGDFDMPVHCKKILKGKPMKLFDEMLRDADYPDTGLTQQVCRGFDLLGPIPDSG